MTPVVVEWRSGGRGKQKFKWDTDLHNENKNTEPSAKCAYLIMRNYRRRICTHGRCEKYYREYTIPNIYHNIYFYIIIFIFKLFIIIAIISWSGINNTFYRGNRGFTFNMVTPIWLFKGFGLVELIIKTWKILTVMSKNDFYFIFNCYLFKPRSFQV